MGKFRDGMAVTGEVSLILAAIDRIKTILDGLEKLQREPPGDDADLIRELNRAAAIAQPITLQWQGDRPARVASQSIRVNVLERAQKGLYSQFEVQRGLPVKLLLKYFTQVGQLWQIVPEVRAMVKFRAFNLLADFASLGSFDAILCRNVLIYFDQDTKTDVLCRLAEAISSDGYLVLGAAESALGLSDRFRMMSGKPVLTRSTRRARLFWRNRA